MKFRYHLKTKRKILRKIEILLKHVIIIFTKIHMIIIGRGS